MDIINSLIECNCVKTGKFTLRNGNISRYYFDMKNLISHPKLLAQIGDLMYESIRDRCDVICGVPMGGLPLATYISTRYGIPMIIPRKTAKGYGMGKQIEGEYTSETTCIIIEDVITTGSSINEVVDILRDELIVLEAVVVIDRQAGDKKNTVPVLPMITRTDIVKTRLKNLVEIRGRLCFSADITDTERLEDTLEQVGPHISICKIHSDIYEDELTIRNIVVDAANKHGFLIMEDRKYVDISHITLQQYAFVRDWVDMVTVMSTISKETIREMSGVMIVANMSNNRWDFTNWAKDLAINCCDNVVGFITQKPIRNLFKLRDTEDELSYFWNMTPGVSLTVTRTHDQRYRTIDEIDTDIIIVGRGIYNAEDPSSSATDYCKYKKQLIK